MAADWPELDEEVSLSACMYRGQGAECKQRNKRGAKSIEKWGELIKK